MTNRPIQQHTHSYTQIFTLIHSYLFATEKENNVSKGDSSLIMSNINTTHWKKKKQKMAGSVSLWWGLEVRLWREDSIFGGIFSFFPGFMKTNLCGQSAQSRPLFETPIHFNMKHSSEEKRRQDKSHSVALRVKERRGRDLPFPNIILCSSFCCFCLSCCSFMRSSWIFLCSSTIRSWSSAWNKHMGKNDFFNQPREK